MITSTETLNKTKTTHLEAPRFKVLVLNDDYTPSDFVVHVLKRYFGLSELEAKQVMLEAHQSGVAVAGIYSFEIAETKANQAMKEASNQKYPFSCMLEPE